METFEYVLVVMHVVEVLLATVLLILAVPAVMWLVRLVRSGLRVN